ncbi:hypothetical protein CDAR_98251 [Caerostris darwini]|uniref:Uncharacterized protein n=1 Tax=Caerostris darwini TaxID=1538125 RepID=A0AAV4UFN0_9ARAC|nr:hypothetical protein CDAR_98251 [Caerostris darwini]
MAGSNGRPVCIAGSESNRIEPCNCATLAKEIAIRSKTGEDEMPVCDASFSVSVEFTIIHFPETSSLSASDVLHDHEFNCSPFRPIQHLPRRALSEFKKVTFKTGTVSPPVLEPPALNSVHGVGFF